MRSTVIGTHLAMQMTECCSVPLDDHRCHRNSAAKAEGFVKHSKAAAEQASAALYHGVTSGHK